MRERLTYSNVVSTVCLFIVLGGTSYAVATGSIDSREVKNNTIRSGDLRNNDVRSRDVRNRTLVGRDHLSNSLGGAEIAEAQLGKVPSAGSADSAANALALGGLPASVFATKPLSRSVGFEEDAEGPLLEVPGYGTLAVTGCDPSAGEVDLEFQSAAEQLYWRTFLDLLNNTVSQALSPGEAADGFTLATADGSTGTIHLVRSDQQPGQALIQVAFASTDQGTICRVAAMALVSG